MLAHPLARMIEKFRRRRWRDLVLDRDRLEQLPRALQDIAPRGDRRIAAVIAEPEIHVVRKIRSDTVTDVAVGDRGGNCWAHAYAGHLGADRQQRVARSLGPVDTFETRRERAVTCARHYRQRKKCVFKLSLPIAQIPRPDFRISCQNDSKV
jgi:hypothetical protein